MFKYMTKEKRVGRLPRGIIVALSVIFLTAAWMIIIALLSMGF